LQNRVAVENSLPEIRKNKIASGCATDDVLSFSRHFLSPKFGCFGRKGNFSTATLYYAHHPIVLAFFSRSIKLSEYEGGGTRVPATVSAIADAIQWAEQIMARVDERWPAK
jgi:hypothetical protein